MNNEVLFAPVSSEWYTPPEIISAVIAVLGIIDLDPCSPSHTGPVPARYRYTPNEDGLSQIWHGRIFMNPPYGRMIIDQWVKKAIEEYESGRVQSAILLLPARTDTKWFALLEEYPWCAVRGRLKFSGCKDSAPFPSVLVFLGKDRDRFIEVFSQFGPIYQKVQSTQPVPVLPAYQAADGLTWWVWCDHCKAWHVHGAHPGHRVEHCHTDGSPYRDRGYVLQYAGELTPEIRSRYRNNSHNSTMQISALCGVRKNDRN